MVRLFIVRADIVIDCVRRGATVQVGSVKSLWLAGLAVRPAVVELAHLTSHLVDGLVDRLLRVEVGLLGAKQEPARANGDLYGGDVRPGPLRPPSEFKVRFRGPIDQAIELLGPSFGIGSKVVGHLNVDTADMNVHEMLQRSVNGRTAIQVGMETRGADARSSYSRKVPAEGFEPPTPSLGRRRS